MIVNGRINWISVVPGSVIRVPWQDEVVHPNEIPSGSQTALFLPSCPCSPFPHPNMDLGRVSIFRRLEHRSSSMCHSHSLCAFSVPALEGTFQILPHHFPSTPPSFVLSALDFLFPSSVFKCGLCLLDPLSCSSALCPTLKHVPRLELPGEGHLAPSSGLSQTHVFTCAYMCCFLLEKQIVVYIILNNLNLYLLDFYLRSSSWNMLIT